MITEFIQFSLTPILIGILAGISCAVPGNFLILKRQALIGDAISHVVLPGIVIAFIFTGVVSTIPMLLGAAAAAIVAVLLIEVIKRFGKIEPGAAMGVRSSPVTEPGLLDTFDPRTFPTTLTVHDHARARQGGVEGGCKYSQRF